MAMNIIQNLTDELSRLEARRIEVKGQLRTIELCQPTPTISADDLTSGSEGSPAKEANVLQSVLQASYDDLKKRHFHLQNDHAALLNSTQDLKIQNNILIKKCHYLSTELNRLAGVNLSSELIRLASFASDNGPTGSESGDIPFEHTASTAEHSNDAGEEDDKAAGKANGKADGKAKGRANRKVIAKRSDVEMPANVQPKVVQKRGRGRPRKVPLASCAAAPKRGRKPNAKLTSSLFDVDALIDVDDDSKIYDTLTQASRAGKGNMSDAKRKQQFEESKQETEDRKRASIEARNNRMKKRENEN